MRTSLAKVRNCLSNVLFGLALFACASYSAYGQVFKKPPLKKQPTPAVRVPDLIIEDLLGVNPDTVSIQIGNNGPVDAVSFTIRLSLMKPGESKKTYVDKRVFGLKSKDHLALDIKVGQPIKDLVIGVFVDAKNEVPETNETNCGKIFPDGGVAGFLSCKDF